MKNKFLNIVCGLIAIAIIGTSCEKDPEFREFNYPAAVPSGMSPASGYAMTNVTITGTNLDTLKGAVKIWFGGIQATNIVSAKGNQIVVQVPANAVSGKVSLQVWTTKVDSVGTYTVIPSPVINSVASQNAQSNVAFPGDTLAIKGIRFGTDASKMVVNFNGTQANIITPITDTLFKVIAPASFASGNVTLTMGGLTLTATPAIINPTAAGDITPYFLGNTGDTVKGGGFTNIAAPYDGRWGVLAAPWRSNAAALNKTNGTIGGYGKEAWGIPPGYICWETWGNTPVTDGIIYQPTSMALPAGSYTFSFKYYAEVQTNSTVYGVVAEGGNGIPVLADLGTALASVQCYNGTAIGSTTPNLTETKSITFTLASSQVVSIGFLGNLAGATTKGAYFRVAWIKLVKN
ncbi:DUF5013 domain-containing protein [Terrimonas pollutisoli]|uniref:DUF5013 domain-containing protein n=1 Tax=Terrimonas pollutisoli TaxID=3034147 RepID=UPI0023ED40F4|nr:DUF5013 domain-containing protein [Terrimonas sp. H1YJ31]